MGSIVGNSSSYRNFVVEARSENSAEREGFDIELISKNSDRLIGRPESHLQDDRGVNPATALTGEVLRGLWKRFLCILPAVDGLPGQPA